MKWSRTHTCGELRKEHVGQEAILMGWVHRRRDHGGLIFIDLRDRYGLTQVVFNPAISAAAHGLGSTLRNEFVIAVRGKISARPEGTVNPALDTGEIELLANDLEILNTAKTPPFYINEETEVEESIRLRYRYLDLRRAGMREKIILRHQVIKLMRDFLDERGFLEIETPTLIKSTPEGARDYLVPSRLYPGKFYALPQSPQQLKQLLMVAGFDRYFQIARCYRDEDQRGDRQPEFTQLDMEMSFVTEEEVMGITEELFSEIVDRLTTKKLLASPFPRLTYEEAMSRYGSDKPDLRFGMELVDLSTLVAGCKFQVFRSALEGGGQVKAIVAPGMAGVSRKELDDLVETAKRFGAKGLAWLAVKDGEAVSPVAKFFSGEELSAILEATGAADGDLILSVADSPAVAAEVLSRLRSELGARLNLIDKNILAFCWIVDFPLFRWSAELGHYESEHHPFTAPKEEDAGLLDKDPLRVKARHYDLVCNGFELGSGSIRIHNYKVQEKVFKLLGYAEEEIHDRFGPLLRSFRYGAPPHGGIAPGIDRLVMILADEDNIREVIAFPKNQSAQDMMMEAPNEVEPGQLKDLHLKVEE